MFWGVFLGSASVHSFNQSPVCLLQTLYPLSLINGSLDDAKTSLSSASSAIGRNLAAHQGYAMVTGEAR